MQGFNRVILGGNLTRDPELRFTQDGTPVANFGIAVNRRKADGTDEAHFFDVSAWRGTGEAVANHKSKGDPVLIEGRLNFSQYQDRDGNQRNKVDVVAQTVQFLSNGNGGGSANGSSQQQGATVPEEDYSDLPF